MYSIQFIYSVIHRYHTEFGFTLPGRPIVVDDIRIRGVGKAFSETDKLIGQASGPPRVETVSDLYYCKVPKFSDTRNLCCNLPKIQTKRPNLKGILSIGANGIAYSDDPDQTDPDLGLHCLPRPSCPKTYGHYGKTCLTKKLIIYTCKKVKEHFKP